MPRNVTAPFHIPVRAYRRQLELLVRQALKEDIGRGDVTVKALDLGNKRGSAVLVAKSAGVLAGVDAFERAFRSLDRRCQFTWKVREGARIRTGTTVVRIRARAAALLTGERTAINFLARLSGIATATRRLADLLPEGPTRLLDTRKTTPGWRFLEKRATIIGGAINHRLGLYDALMVKDTHVGAVGSARTAVQRALAGAGRKTVICEIHDPSEIDAALELGAHWLMLDNFRIGVLRAGVRKIRGFARSRGIRVVVEASGGVNSKSIASIARCGVDFISVGCITHSATAVDFSMRWAKR